jgi:hypothetical protein
VKAIKGAMVMVILEQSKAIELVRSVGKEAWFLYSGLRFMAVESIVNITHQGMADLLGVSLKFVQRHLKTLQEAKAGDEPLIRAVRTAEGYSYVVTAIAVSRDASTPLLVQKKKTVKSSPTNELFDYWLIQYQEAYGVAYQVTNFGKEKGHIRTLSSRYGADVELVKAIIDVVIRLYPTKWKTAQFMRPTLGALVSWLAAQAEPMARANMEASADVDVTITDEDGLDVFAAYDKAWGLE